MTVRTSTLLTLCFQLHLVHLLLGSHRYEYKKRFQRSPNWNCHERRKIRILLFVDVLGRLSGLKQYGTWMLRRSVPLLAWEGLESPICLDLETDSLLKPKNLKRICLLLLPLWRLVWVLVLDKT